MRWKKLRDNDGTDKVKNIIDRNSFKDTPYMRLERVPIKLGFNPFSDMAMQLLLTTIRCIFGVGATISMALVS